MAWEHFSVERRTVLEAWSGFAGAVVGGALTGAVSILLQREQHKHALEVQKREWENERNSRNEEREVARHEEFNKEQRDIWRELRQVTPRFVHVSRWIYQRKLELWREFKKADADPATEDASDRAKENFAQYRELRERLQILLGQVRNEKVREAGFIIEIIGSDMERVHPRTWTESSSFYGGHDPQFLIVPRLEQFQIMLNRLLRQEPIDDIVVYSAVEDEEMIAAIRAQHMPRD